MGHRFAPSVVKRTIDIAVSVLLLLLLSPLLILIAIAVRFRLGSPVLFRQIRPGLAERPFEMLKFRTMHELSGDGPLPDEYRLGRFGRLLRKTSLDELPELWNVAKGDMSLVGPRPLLMEYLPLYSAQQRRRHEVRPGITGWAQVSGRNAIDWDERFRLDVWYVDNQTLWLDLRIIFLTAFKVLRGSGVSQPGHVSMEKFRGNPH